jgi:hypothetical protein
LVGSDFFFLSIHTSLALPILFLNQNLLLVDIIMEVQVEAGFGIFRRLYCGIVSACGTVWKDKLLQYGWQLELEKSLQIRTRTGENKVTAALVVYIA